MKILSTISIAVTAAVLLVSCGGGEGEKGSEADTAKIASDTIDDTMDKIAAAQKVYYSIPSTSEMVELLRDAGAVYNMKMLNDIKVVDKYTTTLKKALNLGIYGADLNYCSIFERNMDIMLYMECIESLAKSLGIENAIAPETIERADANVDNRDSMLVIISDMFYELEEYLAEADKDALSVLIIGGGWVEGLYLATATIDEKKPNKDIMTRIAEQKLSLGNLVKLVESYPENEDLTVLLGDLKKIEAAYADIIVEKQSTDVQTDNTGMLVIGGNTKVEMSMDQFKNLRTVVKEIRDNYIKI
jgi:hypothetical protein